MSFNNSGFSAPNKFLEKQWQKQKYETHKDKVNLLLDIAEIIPLVVSV